MSKPRLGLSVPKVFAAGSLIGFAYYAFMRQYWFPSIPSKTTGVENIEARWTAGGGAPTHQPATATKRGDAHNINPQHDKYNGPETKDHQENLANQTTGPNQGMWPAKFYEQQHNNSKGR